jgi:hypothetical protein
VKELERRLALGTAVAGEIVATTGTCTTGTCTTTTRGAAAANTPFVIGIATLGGSTIASAITAIFPTTGTRGAITAAAAVATTTAAAVATTTAAAVATTTTAAVATTTTAAVATTAAAAVATATAAAATTWGASARLSLIDTKRAAHEFSALETFDGSFFGCIVGHFDKSKSALSAGIPLEGKGTIHDFTELSKQLSHVLLLSAEGKVANKNAHVLRGPGTKKWTKWAWNIAIGP